MYLSTPCGSGRTVLLYHAAMSRRVRLPQGLPNIKEAPYQDSNYWNKR